MGLKEIFNNVVNGVLYAMSCILKYCEKHTKLTQISLKYSNSISLPIWNAEREEEKEMNLEKNQ